MDHIAMQNDKNCERSDYQQHRKTAFFMIQSELYLHSTRDITCKDIILFRTKNTNETNGNTTAPTHLQGRPSWPSLHVLHLSACRGGPRGRPVGRQTESLRQILPNNLCKPLILRRLRHSAVGVGFIPTLPAAGKYLISRPTLVGWG